MTPLRRSFAREKVRILESVASPPAAVLDIGAGRGTFVAEARAAGYAASGIEPASQRAMTSGISPAAVQSVSIEGAEIADRSLDVVTLWHVLEHLEAPDDALRRVSGWLRADGVIIVAVPNIASLQARIGRSRWFHLDVPRHRTHFTPRGLASLLRLVGFEPVLDKRLLLEHNFLGMWQTVVNRVTKQPSYLYSAVKRNISLRSTDLPISLACIPLVPVAVGFEVLADLFGFAGTMVMVARRLPSDRVQVDVRSTAG